MSGDATAASSIRDSVGRNSTSIRYRAVSVLREHWPEYLMEAAELGIFMISACVFTALFEFPGSIVYRALPDPLLRRFLIGLAMAGTAIALIYSSWGKQSGAHMNPAITLTFLRLKKIEPWDALFYVAAQFAGGISGVVAASIVLRAALAHPAVNFAATHPGKAGPGSAFLAEAIISFILMLTVLTVSNNRDIGQFTGFFAATLIAAYVTFEAPLSGMSMNPARTFGSALSARAFQGLWIYFIAPPIGMLLASEVYMRLRSSRAVYCAKLHHHNSRRCIFNCRFPELMGVERQAAGR